MVRVWFRVAMICPACFGWHPGFCAASSFTFRFSSSSRVVSV